MTTDVSQVVAQIPGWEDATIATMPGGLTNRCWLLDNGREKAVLKIDAAKRGEPFGSRREEARIQQQAADAGLAAAVIYASDRVYLSAYLEGAVWSPQSLAEERNLEALATALRRLHALPLTGRVVDARRAAGLYASRVSRESAPARLHDWVDLIEAMEPPVRLACCHNDLVAENIVAAPGLRFLDWEYAGDNDPLFDLATVVAHHALPAARADFLLDAYFEGDGARWREQLDRQVEVYDALRRLWQAARLPAVP